jgi:hypothetical protein
MMSSKSRDTLLIWFGGVVTELISEITIAGLKSEQSVRDFFKQRSEIKQLAEELSLGLRSTHSYCESVIQTTNSSLDVNALEPLILSRASLNKSVLNLFNSIPEKFEKWLISDYPESWFQILSSRMGLLEQFPLDQTIFTSQGGLAAMVPDVFDYITSASGHSLDECVLIDSISYRSVQAVRFGLSAIIYVYPERLEHELALRGILETQEEVLHPQTSRRVDI